MAGSGVRLKDREEIFPDLLRVSALRGEHSTGVAGIELARSNLSREKYQVVKAPYDSTMFLYEEEKKKNKGVIAGLWNDIIIGHCRYATVGKVNVENAHPFELSNLIGAHNGTLVDKEYLGKDKTDSQMMFEAMDKRGIKDVLEDLDPYSAYAVSIYQKKKRIVTLATNHRRPLYIAFLKDRGVVYWASEERMLDLILYRNKEKYEIRYLKPFVIYNIDFDEIKAGNETPWASTEELTDKSKTVTSRIVYPSGYDWMTGLDDKDWLVDEPLPGLPEGKEKSFLLEPDDPSHSDDLWYDYQCEECKKKLGLKEAMKRRVEVPHSSGKGIFVHYVCSSPICQKNLSEKLEKNAA